MNKIRKFKSTFNSNLTEDSSDYISSDVEVGGGAGPGSSSKPKSNSLMDIEDYSNDSFNADAENSKEYSISDKRYKKLLGQTSASAQKQQQQQQQQDSRLAECLNYLHSMIGRKDKEDIFQYPVTDLIAPGYSLIIKNPMDLGTMKKKIEAGTYSNVMEYRDDLILMCENCMTYNKPDTIYYHAARKMLDYGFKLLSRDKILSLRNTVRIMRMLTSDELGFSLQTADPAEMFYDTNSINRNKQQNHHQQMNEVLTKSSPATVSKSKILQKLDALQNLYPKVQDSYLVPPEGEDIDGEDEPDITDQVLEIGKLTREKLLAKNKNGKMGFLRRNSNGTTGYHFLKNGNDNDDETNEKPVTIGNLCEGLQQTSYSMNSFIEDKKNKAKPMHYLENGPFSSHAPVYDSSYSNLSKEETDILLSAYGDEGSYQYALSLLEFSKETTPIFSNHVHSLLNNLSSNDHEKYLKYLKNKKSNTNDSTNNNS